MKPTLVRYKIGYNKHDQMMSIYRCGYCGKEFEKTNQAIASGNTQSCGCLIKMTFAERRIARAVANRLQD